MSEVRIGDTIKVNYTGKLDDDTVFDTTKKSEPLVFTVGHGQVIPGFEQAVIGMKPGDSKKITITPEKAYGNYREDLIMDINRSRFPDNIKPEVGNHYKIPGAENQKILVTVTYVSSKSIKVDANHPLAGKNLTFEIELLEKL